MHGILNLNTLIVFLMSARLTFVCTQELSVMARSDAGKSIEKEILVILIIFTVS